MEDFHIKIPKKKFVEDFTIIYKGRKQEDYKVEAIEEIKTSKEELIRELGYFKNKAYELDLMNEIYIHDIYPVNIFREFIDTIRTKYLRINENNYQYFHKLSLKYEYHELEEQIKQYSQKRPDISNIVNNYSIDDEQDPQKEETIAIHLDICLQNERMLNFPIPVLSRILNSPKRTLKNHHLLFNFVKRKIQMRKNEDKEIYQPLLNSLDYLEMSNDELDELMKFDCFFSATDCRHSKERMMTFIEERKFNEDKIMKLEKRFDKLEIELNDEKKKQKKFINENLLQFKEKISDLDKEKINLQTIIKKQETKLNEQEKTINKLENELLCSNLEGNITLQTTSNDTIDGTINVVEHETQLDKSKSKYLLNNDNSPKLGQDAFNEGLQIQSLSQPVSFKRSAGTYFLHALIVDSRGKSKELLSNGVTIKRSPLTFGFTGRVQSATLVAGRYKLEVWGAEGGKNGEYTNYAGKGGYSVGILEISKQTRLFVYVGESPSTKNGGWNGGGSGGSEEETRGLPAGGGGSTDISLYGQEGSTEWNDTNHLYSRIIVAGAGGGSGHNDYQIYYGGFGGGLSGQCSGHDKSISNSEGTQTRAGTSHNYSSGQGFGIGGSHTGHSSGGGGGWFGGAASNNCECITGSSGGSGYVYDSTTASNYPNHRLLEAAPPNQPPPPPDEWCPFLGFFYFAVAVVPVILFASSLGLKPIAIH